MAQKSYKKKIHDNITVYQTDKLPTGMKVSRIMRIIEKKIPSYFLSEIESFIIADISKFTGEDKMLEGNTIFVSNEHYCEDLLIENFILSVGESLYRKYSHLVYRNPMTEEFVKKRRDLYYDLTKYSSSIALSDFLDLESTKTFERSIRKIEFEDVLISTQKHFVNYESSLSYINYFSHLFNAHMSGSIKKRDYKNFLSTLKDIENLCKEKIENEQIN